MYLEAFIDCFFVCCVKNKVNAIQKSPQSKHTSLRSSGSHRCALGGQLKVWNDDLTLVAMRTKHKGAKRCPPGTRPG